MESFQEKAEAAGFLLTKGPVEILQVNLGKLCNLNCAHCHVEAGPAKTEENMRRDVAEALVGLMDSLGAAAVDLTGGAPELNPHFKYLVLEAKKRNMRIMDRCNLTVFYEPGMSDMPDFLVHNRVEVIASLPCYERENVDRQRGGGTFDQSIRALRQLNQLGYAMADTGLILDLVYNPVGPHLPPPQAELEAEYKEKLLDDFGVIFNRLYTITNMPITRYAGYLRAFHQYDGYVELLRRNFNSATLANLMCRDTLSVGWDGKIYDCDFNQALGIEIRNGNSLTVFDLENADLENRLVLTGDHCFGCTAGAGSSCGGALIDL